MKLNFSLLQQGTRTKLLIFLKNALLWGFSLEDNLERIIILLGELHGMNYTSNMFLAGQ